MRSILLLLLGVVVRQIVVRYIKSSSYLTEALRFGIPT